jgi:LPS export ABC transporter protein LptC
MNRRNLSSTGARRWTALLTVVGVLGACQREASTPVANEEVMSMEADYVQFGMVSYVTTNGVREGRVEADTAYVFKETSNVNLHQMTIVFYDEFGKERATVSGASGEWNIGTDQMVARGDVVLLVHSDSSKIESAEIHYDPSTQKIWSDSTTVRTEPNGTVTSGSAFESDMTFENVRIENARGGARRVS